MDWNEFSREVHQNAVEHGFWERPADFGEVVSLIHSELSEALEEARKGRPMAYVDRIGADSLMRVVDPGYWKDSEKPEGIAVELCDAILRVMDWFGFVGVNANVLMHSARYGCFWRASTIEAHVAKFVADAHIWVSMAYADQDSTARDLQLAIAVVAITMWLEEHGVAWEDLLRRKHAYNRGRPYKHGKRF